MNTLTFLSTLAGGALALNVLEFITARAAACLTRIDRELPKSLPPPPATAVVVETDPLPTAIPAEETAGYWWKRLFTLAGIFGVVITPLQPKILVINSHLLAATLETLLNRPGQPLIPLVIFGWEREITDFNLIGVLITQK